VLNLAKFPHDLLTSIDVEDGCGDIVWLLLGGLRDRQGRRSRRARDARLSDLVSTAGEGEGASEGDRLRYQTRLKFGNDGPGYMPAHDDYDDMCSGCDWVTTTGRDMNLLEAELLAADFSRHYGCHVTFRKWVGCRADRRRRCDSR
jgi:hypothetical protein